MSLPKSKIGTCVNSLAQRVTRNSTRFWPRYAKQAPTQASCVYGPSTERLGFGDFTSTLRTKGVEIPCVRGVAHDVTDILQAQKALRKSEERLRVAAEVGRMYAWEWDPATDSVLRSAECARILGLDDATGAAVAKDYFNWSIPMTGPDLGCANCFDPTN